MVIPVLDEVNHLPLLLADLEAQDLPASEFDVLVLDGGSSDGTRELLDQHVPKTAHGFAVLENPGKTVPHARNMAMAHLSDDVGVVVGFRPITCPTGDGLGRLASNAMANDSGLWVCVCLGQTALRPWSRAGWTARFVHPSGVVADSSLTSRTLGQPKFPPLHRTAGRPSKPSAVGMRPSQPVKTVSWPCGC